MTKIESHQDESEASAGDDLAVRQILADAQGQQDAFLKLEAVPQRVVLDNQQPTGDEKLPGQSAPMAKSSSKGNKEGEDEVDVDLMEIVAERAGQRANNSLGEEALLVATGKEVDPAAKKISGISAAKEGEKASATGKGISPAGTNPDETNTAVVPTTSLRRENPLNENAAPGAYRYEPGHEAEPVGPASRSSFQVGSSRSFQAPPLEQPRHGETASNDNEADVANSDNGLVEAAEVSEEEDLENAMPVDQE
jgi:hypothetical protein